MWIPAATGCYRYHPLFILSVSVGMQVATSNSQKHLIDSLGYGL